MKKILLTLTTLLSLLCPLSLAAETVKDQDGAELSFQAPFKRIISLYPAHTENLLHMGAAKQIIGLTRTDRDIAGAESKQVFSYRDDPEKFIAANADLVLIRPMIKRSYPGLIQHLNRAGITVFSIQPRTAEEMFEYWNTLGKLTGKENKVKQMISDFNKSLKKLEDNVVSIPENDRPKVYFEAIHSKMKTFSPSSIAIFCLKKAGGVNIASDAKPRFHSNIASYGKERILAHADKIDIFLAQQGRMNPVDLETITSESGFRAIKAVQEGRVFLIDESLVSRPTPHLIHGISSIQQILYTTD